MAKVYAICDNGCKYETLTAEDIVALIAEATGNVVTPTDEAFITQIVDQNTRGNLKLWKGTQAEYNALETKDEETYYIITDLTLTDNVAREVASEAQTTASEAQSAAAQAKTTAEGKADKPATATVTIAASSLSGLTATVTVNGVTASNIVVVSPADDASRTEWVACNVRCTGQGANALSFAADTAPSAAITVNVAMWGV